LSIRLRRRHALLQTILISVDLFVQYAMQAFRAYPCRSPGGSTGDLQQERLEREACCGTRHLSRREHGSRRCGRGCLEGGGAVCGGRRWWRAARNGVSIEKTGLLRAEGIVYVFYVWHGHMFFDCATKQKARSFFVDDYSIWKCWVGFVYPLHADCAFCVVDHWCLLKKAQFSSRLVAGLAFCYVPAWLTLAPWLSVRAELSIL